MSLHYLPRHGRNGRGYPSIGRRLAIVSGVLAASIALTVGALAAATAGVPSSGHPVPTVTATEVQVFESTLRPLTAEEIDVLAEGDDADHDWEHCKMNTDYWVFCDDGARVEYPA